MIALVLVILLIGGVFGLALVVAGLRSLGTHRWMAKDDYAILNEQAKQTVKERQEEKRRQPKRGLFKRLFGGLGDSSSLPPCMGL